MQFRNPENGYVESKSVPALWAFLFGGLYFLASALWAPLLVWFVLAVLLYASLGPPATLLMFVINVVYATLAPGLVRNAYLRKGWVEVAENALASVAPPPAVDVKKCPFCAEMIKAEAIKCRYCGSALPEQSSAAVHTPGKVQSPPALAEPEGAKGKCPSCDTALPLAALHCPNCKAVFGPHSAWHVIPLPDKGCVQDPLGLRPADASLMERYGITFDGERYVYSEYRYEKLGDALAYAQLQASKRES